MEVQQNTVATRAQTLQDLALAAPDIQLHLSANPRVAAAYVDIYGYAGPGGLARPDARPPTGQPIIDPSSS